MAEVIFLMFVTDLILILTAQHSLVPSCSHKTTARDHTQCTATGTHLMPKLLHFELPRLPCKRCMRWEVGQACVPNARLLHCQQQRPNEPTHRSGEASTIISGPAACCRLDSTVNAERLIAILRSLTLEPRTLARRKMS